jgi:hypothetical protein
MKTEDLVDKLAYFFNDFIGAVVPGSILIVLLLLLHPGLWPIFDRDVDLDNPFVFLIFAGICYALGHGLLALYYSLTEPLLRKLPIPHKKHMPKRYLVRGAPTIMHEATQELGYEWVKRLIVYKFASHLLPKDRDFSPHDIRNIAMTMSQQGGALARRFMFIALLTQGTGNALFVLAVETIILAVSCWVFELQSFLIEYPIWWGFIIQAVLLATVALFFFSRGDDFYARALKSPFLIAAVEIAVKK